MKLTPNEKRLRERMAPGVLSQEGFLGSDDRPVAEIVEADQAVLEALGVTARTLAAKMQEIYLAAREAQEAPVQIGECLLAQCVEVRGGIACPFADGRFDKGEVNVRNLASGEEIRFTPLAIHLVGEHGFFEGRGSPFRIGPEVLCRALGLI